MKAELERILGLLNFFFFCHDPFVQSKRELNNGVKKLPSHSRQSYVLVKGISLGAYPSAIHLTRTQMDKEKSQS